jgi:hypothetical protein
MFIGISLKSSYSLWSSCVRSKELAWESLRIGTVKTVKVRRDVWRLMLVMREDFGVEYSSSMTIAGRAYCELCGSNEVAVNRCSH